MQMKGMDGFLYWTLKQVTIVLMIHEPQTAQTPAQPSTLSHFNKPKYAAANQAN